MATTTRLNRKRGAIKHKVTNFATFLEPIEASYSNGVAILEKTITDLKIRLAN